jgi:hypothetical protein
MITPEQFEKCHQDFIDMWAYLEETGDRRKPNSKYVNHCASCEITRKAGFICYARSRVCCLICPIDEWRDFAKKCFSGGCTSCESAPESPYVDWLQARTPEERKRAAGRVKKLKWTYLPEYGEERRKKSLALPTGVYLIKKGEAR